MTSGHIPLLIFLLAGGANLLFVERSKALCCGAETENLKQIQNLPHCFKFFTKIYFFTVIKIYFDTTYLGQKAVLLFWLLLYIFRYKFKGTFL